jgi:hypothetical protein
MTYATALYYVVALMVIVIGAIRAHNKMFGDEE